MRTYDPESYKALLSGDLSLLKTYAQIMVFLYMGPFGMALFAGLKLGGVDLSPMQDAINTGVDIGAKVFTTTFPPLVIAKHHRAIGRAFEDSYEAVEDSVKEITNLLEDGVKLMLDNVKKLAKISEKLGKDAAKKVAGMGKEGIDKVSDLVDRLPLGQVGDAINKGLGEVGKLWSSVFGWIPL
jgi:hypothetical protein